MLTNVTLYNKKFWTIALCYFSICLIIIFSSKLEAQNLVPNPSFENVDLSNLYCNWTPTDVDFENAMSNWTLPTGGTPDIFSTQIASDCWNYLPLSTYSGTADCVIGNQMPRSGQNVIGLYTFGSIREYLQVQLTSNLVIGQEYQFSMWVSLADYIGQAANNLGFALRNAPINNATSTPLDFINAVGKVDNPITEVQDWAKVSFVFTATEASSYLLIGNFNTNATTNIQATAQTCHPTSSYYFIDDVSLTLFDPQLNISAPAQACENEEVSMLATVNEESVSINWYLNTDTTTTIGTDSTLNYTITDTTTFIVKANFNGLVLVDSVSVASIPTLNLPNDSLSICLSDTAQLDATYPNTTAYSWSNGLTTPQINIHTPGAYTATITDNYTCTNTKTYIVDQLPTITPNLSSDVDAICFENTATISLNNPNDFNSYMWQHNSSTSTSTTTAEVGTYTLAAIDTNNCAISQSYTITNKSCVCEAIVPTAFSPNSDNVNDAWQFFFPCAVTQLRWGIYDRWGNEIYKESGVTIENGSLQWDGKNTDGTNCNAGVYAYYIYYNDLENEPRLQQGNLSLIR